MSANSIAVTIDAVNKTPENVQVSEDFKRRMGLICSHSLSYSHAAKKMASLRPSSST